MLNMLLILSRLCQEDLPVVSEVLPHLPHQLSQDKGLGSRILDLLHDVLAGSEQGEVGLIIIEPVQQHL